MPRWPEDVGAEDDAGIEELVQLGVGGALGALADGPLGTAIVLGLDGA